jgi:MATE family multidrug resistance protein
MAYMIPLGISIAISARVGFFMGRDNIKQLVVAAKTGAVLAITLALMSAVMMSLFATNIANLYTDDIAVVTVASSLLVFAAIFQLSDATQVSLSGVLRGMKDTKIPMIISAIAYWLIGFPIGYYWAEVLAWGVKGYWLGIIAGLTAAGVLLFGRYRKLITKLDA